MELKTVRIEVPKECNVILGMAHFIKTVEDLYEALINSVPDARARAHQIWHRILRKLRTLPS